MACTHLLKNLCGCPREVAGVLIPASRADAQILPSGPAAALFAGGSPSSPPARAPAELSSERLDGWMSLFTGIGTNSFDKRTTHQFTVPTLAYTDAIDLWRGDDLAARAINSLPEDCFRQGYDISFGREGKFDELKEDLELRMGELKVDELVERLFKYERAFGGGAILLGVDDGRKLDEPLDLSRVKSLDWLTVLEPLEVYPSSYYQDPSSAKYGEPEFYRLQAFTISGAGTVIGVTDRRAPPPTIHLIHESRLIVFGGIRVSRYQRNLGLMGPLWGDSMLVRLVEALRDFNVAWASAGLIATDFAQSVISIENLMQLVAKDEKRVIARLQALEMGRSTARAILLDTKENYQRQSTSITGLPELLDRLSARLASAIDIPLSLLFGQTPKGLGADASQDVRWYYDKVQSVQRRRIGPVVRTIASLIMGTMRKKKLPKRWSVRFHPLWQLTDQEKAEARLTQARADSMYVKAGAVWPQEIRDSRFGGEYSFETSINESKKAPGIPMPPVANGGGAGPGAPTTGAGAMVNNQPHPMVHGVRGYARKNPQQARGITAHAKEGGDVAPENRRDADRDVLERRTHAGIPIAIEGRVGSKIGFTRPDGTPGEVELKHDYGHIPGVRGADGDSLDAFVGPHEDAPDVHIGHVNSGASPNLYHQDKVMLGFASADEARAALMSHYDDEKYYAGITSMPRDKFMEVFGLNTHAPGSGAESTPDDSRGRALEPIDANAEAPLAAQISGELAGDYPESVRAWIHTVKWQGPVRVSIADIDYSKRTQWHASELSERPKVEKFVERIQGGWEKPILLVRRPDGSKLFIVDGHHRALAYFLAHKRVLAYVGDVPTVEGPWEDMHDQQRSKADKRDARAVLRADSLATRESIGQGSHKIGLGEIDVMHMDRIVQRGTKFMVLSENKGRHFGEYDTKAEAVQRLREVEYFKAHPEHGDAPGDEEIYGGWPEQETGYEVDKPDKPAAPKQQGELWNAQLHQLSEEEG